MSEGTSPFRIAAAQAAPVFLDRAATIEKACGIIGQAATGGARLVVFPECYVPGFPLWVWHVPAGETRQLRELYAELFDNAVEIPSAATERLCQAAREANTAVAIGVNERNTEASGTTLHNTILFVGPDGRVLGRHRKLVPTTGERLVHGRGDGSSLVAYDLPIGRLGGLVCWESYMPLARYALYCAGVQIYAAPTWDRGEPWLSTLRHIAKEGRVYVVGCGTAMRRDDVPDRFAFKHALPPAEWVNPGDSAIVDPDGKLLAGPLREQEGILFADADPRQVVGSRFQLDVAGHYARPDVFRLLVDRRARPTVEPGEATTEGRLGPESV
jgi:nitrilase